MKKIAAAVLVLSLSMLFFSCADKMENGVSDEFIQGILDDAESDE